MSGSTVHWMDRKRKQGVVREWNKTARIGQLVDHQGTVRRLESPAAFDVYWRPCCFVSGIETPVLLVALRLLEPQESAEGEQL